MVEAGENTIVPAIPARRRFLPRRRWATILLLACVVVAILLAGLFFLRKNAPPEAARLLPESDGVVYVDVAPIRAVVNFDAHPVQHDPEYQHFIDATGIQFERDLDEAAFALHSMSNPLGPNGAVAFSSIFVGHFDHTRLTSYLEGLAQSKEHYAGHDIYNIPIDGRIDRVAILGSDKVAVSNTPTAEQIHSILDRQRTALLPFSGNSLLAQRYHEVPLFSLAWGLGKLAVGLGDDLKIFGFKIPLSVDATFIASVRWTGSVHLRIEEIAPNGASATLSADSLDALLGIFKGAENALPNAITDPNTKALLNSVEIEHHNDRAVVTAIIPLGILQKLATPDDKSNRP